MGFGRRKDDGQSSTDVGPSGLDQPDVVDYVVAEADGGISLRISDTRAWDGGQGQVDQLLAKINSYVAFIRDGELVAQFPDAGARPVRIVLQSFHTPEGEVTEAFPLIRQGLDTIGVGFDIEILGGAGW